MQFPEFVQTTISHQSIQAELEQSFPYYQTLSDNLKERFVERTAVFIQKKKFVSRQGLTLTDPIRILISACAVQLTLGLNSFTIDTFEHVVVYPDVYESPLTGKMHKGETNLSGFICLSWKHVLEGIKDPNDNYNLGIHEWTHALRFNSIYFEPTDYFFDGYINKWVAHAMQEFTRLKAGKQSIFRRYGSENIHEFLSVCTEHFFESPDEFKSSSPEFFKQMCILFNQEPGKEKLTKIYVRNRLLEVNHFENYGKPPLLTLEASFVRTLFNMGFGLVYFSAALILLLSMSNLLATLLAASVGVWGVIVMNNKYFTIKFYDDYIYLKIGFIGSFHSRMRIKYNSLIKLEIQEGNYNNSFGTVFQLDYYDGREFLKRTVYCSAIKIPQEKIVNLLHQKKVGVLVPN